MSIADKHYKEIIRKILDEGEWDTDGQVRPTYADGTPAHSKSIFGYQVKFEQGEIPAVTIKHTPVVGSNNEVVHQFWIRKSNKYKDMKELGIGYWEEWLLKDGTIGESYGRQLKRQKTRIKTDRKNIIHHFKKRKRKNMLSFLKEIITGNLILDQVDAVLYRLKHDPNSRRIIFSYWRPDEDHKKALKECAYTGQFEVRNNKLNFILIQRSVDVLLGLPSNWIGYYDLQCALANVTGYEVGTFTHQMGNVHLYDNQIELAKKLLDAPEYEQPSIYVNPEVKNFYDYTVDDIKVINYKHGDKVRSDVAI